MSPKGLAGSAPYIADATARRVELPPELPVLAVRNTVLFPDLILPLVIARPQSVELIHAAAADDRMIGVVAQRDPDNETPTPQELFDVGSAGVIVKTLKFPDNSIRVMIRGVARFRVDAYTRTDPFFRAQITQINDELPPEATWRPRFENLRRLLAESPVLQREVVTTAQTIEAPGTFCDYLATVLDLKLSQMQEFLEITRVDKRLDRLSDLLQQALAAHDVRASINDEVKQQIDKSQREYYLRQQLKAIRRELGDDEELENELEEFRERLAKASLPPEAQKEAERELKRMERMHAESAEYTVARTYLDWLCELPWATASEEKLDIARAQDILDADHYAMEKPKERIIEYLAVRKLKPDMKGPILCLLGPPGVGKTSLGRSVAKATGRKFERIALGGVRDEAEIRGHRRTYVGAMPGRVIRAMRRVGANNPVLLLDEIDKLGNDFRGDPAAALLEVLDPEQNNTFNDHYLDVPFDLSKVIFIATANVLDPIPAALRDRMEVIELPGYTLLEKSRIARQHIIPRQMENHGLTPHHLTITDAALDLLISSYTREAGLRNLDREVAAICRKVAARVARDGTHTHHDGSHAPFLCDEATLQSLLGQPRFVAEVAERADRPGIAIGLAWTPVGGDILFIEATRMKGKKTFLITGKLGDVMSESAQTALSYIRSHAENLGLDDDFFEHSDLHVHVPAGAIPKDGPSAGITIATAIASLATSRLVRPDTAMTGEITLRGKVLPVGGIKEKVLAAARAGITRVILPKGNAKDLTDVPQETRDAVAFFPVETMDDVLALALAEKPGNPVAEAQQITPVPQ